MKKDSICWIAILFDQFIEVLFQSFFFAILYNFFDKINTFDEKQNKVDK